MQILEVDVSSGGGSLKNLLHQMLMGWIMLKNCAGSVNLDFIPTHGKHLKFCLLQVSPSSLLVCQGSCNSIPAASQLFTN